MGGLGPGIGGFELVVIGIVALLVVGPKDLPILMRRVGQMVGKARAMANEFRSSFDEMARQSELDDLRKEVEALRSGQGMYPLGQEAENAFKEINAGLNAPVETAAPPSPENAPENTPVTSPEAAPEPETSVMTPAPEEWPDEPASVAASQIARTDKDAPRTKKAAKSAAGKKKTAKGAGTTSPKTKKTTRKKAVEL